MKDIIKTEIQSNLGLLFNVGKYIYDNPELSQEEYLAAKRLIDEFKAQGFAVDEKICNLPPAISWLAWLWPRFPGPSGQNGFCR